MSNNVFHDHLDACKHCRENPFALCRVGTSTLKKAVQDLALDSSKTAKRQEGK